MADDTSSSRTGSELTGAPPAEAVVPITEPLIAAFEAGRQLNRLSFHLQQAWFFADRYHVQAAEGAANALRRAYAVLLPVPQGEAGE
jgi:hypothetical protein